MNNLYTAISSAIGFNSILVGQNQELPYSLNDVKINLNDIVSTDNFNFSLSALYSNFLEVGSRSYFYNPKIPITNPALDANVNTVGTLCGAFVPTPGNTSNIGYYVNGIAHSLSAYNVIYDVHDFYINDEFLTLAVGILSAETLSTTNDFKDNKYYSHLLLANYSLSGLYQTSNLTYSANFGNEGQPFNFNPEQVLVYSNLLGADLQFNNIKKLKFLNDKLYLLDSANNNFIEIDTSDFVINRGISSSYKVPVKKLGFTIPNNFNSLQIETFCINSKYFAFYNYRKNAITIFTNSFKKLFDYFEPSITATGSRIHEAFADLQFSNNGDLYLLTEKGIVFVYEVNETTLSIKKKFSLKNNTVLNYESFNPAVSSFQEIFTGLTFSKSDDNCYYVSTERNVYKKFLSNNGNVGQFNTGILNTTYFSTLSGTLDAYNTLTNAFSSNTSLRKNSFLKYKIRNVNSINFNNKELVSIGFIDNCTYNKVIDDSIDIENVSGTSTSFVDAQLDSGINPVSGSGISFLVDSPNFINLNNESLTAIELYDFDDIKVKDDEFVTDFSINKSIRKLLYNIYNYQTYLVYRPVIDLDVNNNPVLIKLEYVIPYNKDQDFSNFDNFVGINEINSTVFLNRCFSKIYNLIESVKNNLIPDTRDIFPRLNDSIQITDNEDNHIILFEDSKQYINGTFRAESYPLNKNLCLPLPTVTPTSTPVPTSTGYNVTPTPTATWGGGTGGPTPTPTPTPTMNFTPTPDVSANVAKKVKHTVEVSLDNDEGLPQPSAPFLTSTYSLSALYKYNNTSYETLVSEKVTYFDQVQFAIDVSSVSSYYDLVGRTYSDYTLVSYTSAVETDYKIAGRTTSSLNYDKPARVVWQSVFDMEGIRNADSINFIAPERSADIYEQFEEITGVYNTILTGGLIDNEVRYSITDTENTEGRSTFNWSFSAYKGAVLSYSVLLGTNYINNNTAYDLELLVNSDNTDFTNAFNFSPAFPGGTYLDSNTIIIPAGARNYPVVLWCNINSSDKVSTFRCELSINGLPSSTIQIENNVARWTKP